MSWPAQGEGGWSRIVAIWFLLVGDPAGTLARGSFETNLWWGGAVRGALRGLPVRWSLRGLGYTTTVRPSQKAAMGTIDAFVLRKGTGTPGCYQICWDEERGSQVVVRKTGEGRDRNGLKEGDMDWWRGQEPAAVISPNSEHLLVLWGEIQVLVCPKKGLLAWQRGFFNLSPFSVHLRCK